MDIIAAMIIRNGARKSKYISARCFLLRNFVGGLSELCVPNMQTK
jgi:hypothetical protein